MKKIFALLSILLCYLSGYTQTLSPSSTTIQSGDVVIITGQGETNSGYFSHVSVVPTGITSSSPDAFGSNWVSLEPAYEMQFYNTVTHSPTSFKMKITNGHPDYDYTITFTVMTSISAFPGSTQTNVPKTVTLTVKHKPTIFYNDAKSQPFYKNDCGPGFESDAIYYSVPANKYSSTTKEAANAMAQAEINANGQNKANTEGICKQVYYNTEVSASFTNNSCGAGYIGSTVTYIVPSTKHKSLISQADADLKATNDLNTNGQNYANTHGSCTEDRKRYRVWLRPTSPCTSTDEISGFIWIRRNHDLNNLYSQGSIVAYTSADGDTKAAEGNYRFLYEIADNGEQGIRIFNIDSSGYINNYNLCPN